MPGPETAALVRRAINGDTQAYGDLYKTHLGRVYRYLYYRLGDTMAAEDIAEDVFLKAWKAIKSCRGKENTFVTWLYRIAHSCLVDSLRKKKDLTLGMEDPPSAHDVIESVELSMEWERILEAVDGLPEQQRQLIILKFIDNADNSEIERIMGKRQGAIRALQMRALINLRQRLRVEASEIG
jgi:RNA polymerase sigma-70 factor (ECF subfamily)